MAARACSSSTTARATTRASSWGAPSSAGQSAPRCWRFRRTPALARALGEPFHSRWAFDVELLGRILPAKVIEVPLETWHDVKGSKISTGEMVKAGLSLGRIAVELRRWRRRQGQG